MESFSRDTAGQTRRLTESGATAESMQGRSPQGSASGSATSFGKATRGMPMGPVVAQDGSEIFPAGKVPSYEEIEATAVVPDA